jgi:signal transduction histidine kinase
VSDTGPGIPASHLDQIFDTFFTTKPTGTGLGLALARKVIEDHGATIEVQSAEGVGTTFTIAFDLDYEIPPPLLAPELVRRQIYERGHANGQANDSGH